MRVLCSLFFVCHFAIPAAAADWLQFRGPGGLGIASESGAPVEWSADKNLAWRIKLPGPGGSSPIVVGKRVFVTCYSGYAVNQKDPGKMEDLKRHLLCVDRGNGQILWHKEFAPKLPEHKYAGEGAYHGYSSSTPASDGERLYVFFGKSGVYCFDLDGKELWHVSVGDKIDARWGSGASPILYKNLLIVNASIESGKLVALDKMTGKEVWNAPGISQAWNMPILVPPSAAAKDPELVVSIQGRILSFDPDSGKKLWDCDGVHRYVCPSVVAAEGVIYAIGGGHTSLAVQAGGRGDVTKSHEVWRTKKGSNVSSPIYHDRHLYWASESAGTVHCQDAATGKFIFSERLKPDCGLIYASPVLADGKIYFVSQRHGTYVVAARPKFEILAHNAFADDKSRTNASPALSDGQWFLRSDEQLVCIGKK